ncbi:MAG: hypothetical protein RR131_03935 [Anaerovorax sp.]
MEKDNFKWGNVIKFAGAFVAFLIGAGFATGQEILQYFTSYGYQGFLTAAVVLIAFIYVGIEFSTTGYREKFHKGSEVFQYYCGKPIGLFYDYFTIAFVFMSYVVMVAGAGATFNQHYGIPTYVGGIVMMILATGTVIFGLGNIVNVIGKIGPVIVIIALGLGLSAIIMNPEGIGQGAAMIQNNEIELKQAGSNWFMSASSYIGFCMLWLAAFLTAMGTQANCRKEAGMGSAIGAVGFVLGCVILMLGLLAYLPEVAVTQIPSLILAMKIAPALATVFSIIIMAGIYTTAVPLLWQASSRFTEEGTKTFKIVTVALGIIGCFIGLALPFNSLVNIIYVINGYVGILLIFFMIVKTIRRTLANKKTSTSVK